MNSKEKWVVTMDLTKMDSHILKYVHFLSSHYNPEKIYFVHVVRETESLGYFPSEYQDLMNTVFMDHKLTIEAKVHKQFKDTPLSYEIIIPSGLPFDEVIDLVYRKSANLVIAGKKKLSSGSGIISDRLSRNLPCNFLIVPEQSELKLDKLLITTDFSEHATLAMQMAVEMKLQNDAIELFTHHSYSVPEEYSSSGKSYEDFAEIVKINVEKEMKRWIRKFKLKAKSILTLRDSESLVDQILETAVKNQVNLIIIGSRGQTRESLALLGSNTMKLLKINERIPVLIVKKKGENIKMLTTLRKFN